MLSIEGNHHAPWGYHMLFMLLAMSFVYPQVVKAFVMLSEAYKNADTNTLTREIQEHVKTVTAPYKYPRKASIQESNKSNKPRKDKHIETGT